MRFKKYVIVFTVIMSVFVMMTETTYGAPKTEAKKDWAMSFLLTMQVPDQLEIVDGNSVIREILTLGEKMKKSHPTHDTLPKTQPFSPEDITQFFANHNIGIYQFALKNSGSYNTAMVFAGKLPAAHNAAGLTFFNNLKNMDQQKQEELHKLILKGIDEVYAEVYAKEPDLRDMFQMEILEFYPFEHIGTKDVKIISVGGSVAVRSFKLVQPFAVKTYIINNNSDIYIFSVLNSGPDRKLWENMTKEMLRTARWDFL